MKYHHQQERFISLCYAVVCLLTLMQALRWNCRPHRQWQHNVEKVWHSHATPPQSAKWIFHHSSGWQTIKLCANMEEAKLAQELYVRAHQQGLPTTVSLWLSSTWCRTTKENISANSALTGQLKITQLFLQYKVGYLLMYLYVFIYIDREFFHYLLYPVIITDCLEGSGFSTFKSHVMCWFTGFYPNSTVHWFQGEVNLTDSASTQDEQDPHGRYNVSSVLHVEKVNSSLLYNCSLWTPSGREYLRSHNFTVPISTGSMVRLQWVCVTVGLMMVKCMT